MYIPQRTPGVALRGLSQPEIRNRVDRGPVTRAGRGLAETTRMTNEILFLTGQIGRWLNLQVARHIAAQAAKLPH